ncbi:endolytic transglycosylase MltG [Kitasatospora sp. MAP5-34]|uniref:endolytic transglycosylase MltG n=1 Tax=Kitasatospora sp. MAP5-34 TaxID=3035102 RepID=UPI0024770F39|nr:endolytic transglycosylase MltG [Kitasatospora sp. MAP5-34]MDH6575912.1 UPF0755 protein [Kitasatospora sp. MAP5-34]
MTDLGGGYGPQGSRPWTPGDPGYAGAPDEAAQQPDPWQQQNQQHPQQGQYVQNPYAQQQQQQAAWPQQQGFPQQQQGQQHPQQGQYVQNPYAQQQQQQQAAWPQQQQNQQQQGFPQQQIPQQQQPQQQGQYVQNPYAQQQQQQQAAWPQQQQNQQQQGFPQQQIPQQQQPQAPRNPGMPMRPQPAAQQAPPPAPARPAGPGPDGIDWEAEAAALDSPRVEPEPEAWAEAEHAEQHVDGYPEEYTEADEYAEGEPERESFFGADEQDTSREAERKRKEKGKASGRRNRGACLGVALLLMGGVTGAGYWGYGFYQQHFGPPPDYKGDGTGSVSVEIKAGPGEQMGATLQASDVVKSVKAFVDAFSNNPKANSIQPGSYTLHHQMSAVAAVQELVDSNGGNALVIPEGKKAVDIYTMIDNKLKLQKGATAAAAASQLGTLGLPDYAQGNLEGFLFPARYSVTDGMKPEAMLKQMVAMAVQHYQQLNLDGGAKSIGLANGYQVIIEASILQAEGNNDTDFGKIARVLSNRLNTQATQGKLQLDTTLQYKLGRTNFTKAEKDGDKSPYNTYYSKGLPPTPISNPGDAAIQAVLNPTPGDWVYFVAVSPTDTRFEKTFDDFKNDVKAYCTAHNQGFDPSGMCK